MLLYHTMYMPFKLPALLDTCESICDKQAGRTWGHACSGCSWLQQDAVCVLPSQHGRTATSGSHSCATLHFVPLNSQNVHGSCLQRRQGIHFQHTPHSKSQNIFPVLKNGVFFVPTCTAPQCLSSTAPSYLSSKANPAQAGSNPVTQVSLTVLQPHGINPAWVWCNCH